MWNCRLASVILRATLLRKNIPGALIHPTASTEWLHMNPSFDSIVWVGSRKGWKEKAQLGFEFSQSQVS